MGALFVVEAIGDARPIIQSGAFSAAWCWDVVVVSALMTLYIYPLLFAKYTMCFWRLSLPLLHISLSNSQIVVVVVVSVN